jgi:AcrR family transcriptional regulator
MSADPAPTRLPFQTAARNLLRETVIAAVDDLVRSRGWSATTMSDVAAAAGVSRQTLYNEFGGKDGLAQALSVAETEWFLARTQERFDEHPDDPVAGIRAAVRFTLDTGADDPLLKAVLSGARGANELLPLLTTRAGPLLTASRQQLTAYLTEHWPDLAHRDISLVAESVIRLTVSHLVLPLAPAEQVADQLAELAARALHLPAHPRSHEKELP